MSEKSFGRSFLLLFLSFLIILVYQVLYDHYPVFGEKYRNFAFFEGWVNCSPADSSSAAKDSAALTVAIDTSLYHAAKDSASMPFTGPDSGSVAADLPARLDHFATALHELKSGKRKKVRIAWFGDSMIEGDLIVMTLRNAIQKEFGGEGVGMVPMTSAVAGFRITVKQTFSDNWQEWNVVEQKPPRFPQGLFCTVHTGDVSTSGDPFWVKFKSSNTFKTTSVFHNASLFYGTPSMLRSGREKSMLATEPKAEVYNGDRLIGSFTLDTVGGLQKIDLFTGPLSEFSVYLNSDSAVPYYGISIESDSGVFVDNFASRGNSGIGLWQIDDNMLWRFHDLLRYDLVILQFGTNAMSPGMTDYNWYGHSMNKVLAKLKKGFSGSSFLLISVADRAMKGDNGMQTDPGVPEMVGVQRRIAAKNGMEFLDLYSAMGGEGTIVKWSELEEPLANKDYTHVNFKGARKISDIILNFLLQAYREYEPETAPAINESLQPETDSLK